MSGTGSGAGRAAAVPYPDADLLFVDELLAPAERDRLHAFRTVFQEEVRPRAVEYWNRAEFPFELLDRVAEEGIGGLGITWGSHLLAGLVSLELTRADTSLSTFVGVHNGTVVGSIALLGSDEQRERLLPGLTSLRARGAFALTEPDHGSDISRTLSTTATRRGDEWILDGAKRWVGSAAFADCVIVWARDSADHQIKGFIVEHGQPGFRATTIDDKMSLRGVQNTDIVLDDVRVPESNRLPGARSFRDTSTILRDSRLWVAWQAAGQQFAAFDVARAYALGREQFGRPIASFQLIQEQLVRMLGNATMSVSLLVQLARLQEEDRLSMDQCALAKAMCTSRMRETVALGRSILGGNGIATEFEAGKIFADAEALLTYEGTYEINALLAGRAITGISAFVS